MLHTLPGVDGDELEFDDQRLDMRAVDAGLHGHCHSLALALHRQTGWDMLGIQDQEGDLAHLAVRTPKGQLLDVTGCWDFLDLVKQHSTWHDPEFAFEISEEGIQALGRDPNWRKPQPKAMEALAKLVLQYYKGKLQNLPEPTDDYAFEAKRVYGQPQEGADQTEDSQVRDPLEFFFYWGIGNKLARFMSVRVRRWTPDAEDKPKWVSLPSVELESNPAGLPVSEVNKEAFQRHIDHYLDNLDELEVWQALEASD